MTAADAVPGASSQDARRTAVPLYFGPDGAKLFGWFHRPDGSARGPVIDSIGEFAFRTTVLSQRWSTLAGSPK